MIQPLGYETQGELSRVCRLKKAIYGPTQSLWAWFDKFSTVFARSEALCFWSLCICPALLYGQHCSDGLCGWYCNIWWSHSIVALKEYLSTHIYMKDLGNLCYILGFEVALSKGPLSVSTKVPHWSLDRIGYVWLSISWYTNIPYCSVWSEFK